MNKRNKLIEIATKLFSEKGFENTSLSEICETAKVSKGLISHHFKSKNGLLKEIFKKTTDQIVEMNTADAEDVSPDVQLKTLLESFFAQLESDRLYFQFNLNVIVQPNTRKILDDLIKERSEFILQSTKRIFHKINPKESTLLSYLFIAELDGIALNYLGIFDDYPLEQVKKRIIQKYTAL